MSVCSNVAETTTTWIQIPQSKTFEQLTASLTPGFFKKLHLVQEETNNWHEVCTVCEPPKWFTGQTTCNQP